MRSVPSTVWAAIIPGAAAKGRGLRVLAAGMLALGAARADAATVVDMRGRSVDLPAPPRRIISLVPSVTEFLFALGADDRLVGVTDFCDYPPQARAKPRVGGMLAPSLETMVALRPDLVIATDAGFRRETFAQLGRLGLPVYLVHASRVSEVLDVAERLGALTTRAPAAAALTARIEQRIGAVVRRVQGRPRPRVLYVLWPEPLIVPGRDALLTEVIALAGGDSVSAGDRGDHTRLSLEAAIERAPEVIVLAPHASGFESGGRQRWERLTGVPAVRAGRIHVVDGDVLHRYGPRLADGVEALARLFHPEAFR